MSDRRPELPAELPTGLPTGLIVSCQARPDNPLHGPAFMAAMALAAEQGGASGLRVQGPADLRAVRAVSALPLVGLIKRPGHPSGLVITPEAGDVRELSESGAGIIALDASAAREGADLAALIALAHALGRRVLADLSTVDEARRAAELGADAVATTLHGYTPQTAHAAAEPPDLALLARLVAALPDTPVWAEGRYTTPAQVRAALDCGARAVVVGTAITNPREITRRFAQAVQTRPAEAESVPAPAPPAG